MSIPEDKKQAAYQYCMTIAQNHYENFPVASHLLNKNLRFPISSVYAFARTADDFADEGKITKDERLHSLNKYSIELDRIKVSLDKYITEPTKSFLHHSDNKIFTALADTIFEYEIPLDLFYDLLSAFKQDVNITRYNSFNDILDYCQRSADPVGRILLYLNKSATKENLDYSDAICTGLQLINFYQDIGQDIDENDRLYLTLDELAHYKVSIDDIKKQINNDQTQALINFQLQRTKVIYDSGKPLCNNLKGRFAIEIKMIFAGGQLILEKLQQNTSSIYLRPRLSRKDKMKIIWHGFF